MKRILCLIRGHSWKYTSSFQFSAKGKYLFPKKSRICQRCYKKEREFYRNGNWDNEQLTPEELRAKNLSKLKL